MSSSSSGEVGAYDRLVRRGYEARESRQAVGEGLSKKKLEMSVKDRSLAVELMSGGCVRLLVMGLNWIGLRLNGGLG